MIKMVLNGCLVNLKAVGGEHILNNMGPEGSETNGKSHEQCPGNQHRAG